MTVPDRIVAFAVVFVVVVFAVYVWHVAAA